jgi:hypothetical protein
MEYRDWLFNLTPVIVPDVRINATAIADAVVELRGILPISPEGLDTPYSRMVRESIGQLLPLLAGAGLRQVASDSVLRTFTDLSLACHITCGKGDKLGALLHELWIAAGTAFSDYADLFAAMCDVVGWDGDGHESECVQEEVSANNIAICRACYLATLESDDQFEAMHNDKLRLVDYFRRTLRFMPKHRLGELNDDFSKRLLEPMTDQEMVQLVGGNLKEVFDRAYNFGHWAEKFAQGEDANIPSFR